MNKNWFTIWIIWIFGVGPKSEEGTARKRARNHPFFYTPMDRAENSADSDEAPMKWKVAEPCEKSKILGPMTTFRKLMVLIKVWKVKLIN